MLSEHLTSCPIHTPASESGKQPFTFAAEMSSRRPPHGRHARWSLASDALSVFAGLIEIALLEERTEDARTYAERMQEISNLLGMPTWMGVGSLLTVAVADKDTAETARLLDILLRSLSSPTDRTLSDPIYRHTNGNDLSPMMSCAIELLFNEVKGDDTYHFFREIDAYRAFIAQWTPMTP